MTSVTNAVVSAPSRLLSWVLDDKRASYGLAVMRIGYGSLSLILMILYLPNVSYSFGRAAAWTTPLVESSSVNNYIWPLDSIFVRGESDVTFLLKFALLGAVTVLFILGWRMRIIAPAFLILWMSFSTINPIITNTGHYQSFRVMLIFMVFADLSRRWSLDARRRARTDAGIRDRSRFADYKLPPWVSILFNNAAVVLIGYQLCMIYVTSALWKLQGATWSSGVAVYYPLQLEELTIFPALSHLAWQITPLVFVASWASVYLQLLFPVMLLNRWTRLFILIAITGMHAAIGILLALPLFSAVMIFADAIFIRESTWARIRGWCSEKFRRRREPEPGDAADSVPRDPAPEAAPDTSAAGPGPAETPAHESPVAADTEHSIDLDVPEAEPVEHPEPVRV